ncbi:heterokaryon incompatibility protein-domain-containing protein [Hypoxylon crocopeplum]|nr:heterokaryon incompatibility protein-domain-containing protein [Hypoxylon crocopeplum]
MAPFSYTSFVTEREIRLLDLLPGRGRIQCNLRHVPISPDNHFEALSYCWGTHTRMVKILVNDGDFFVTRNLHAALKRLRDKKSVRTLWIDAICIDQNNIPEKNVQVSLMRNIYGACQRVVIWLGEQDSLTKSAFQGLEFMASKYDAKEEPFAYSEWKRIKRGDSWGFSWLTPRQVIERAESIRAFPSIFERPWFRRVWIIQELVVSSNPVVICGSYQIPWAKLEKARAISQGFFDLDGQFDNLCTYRQIWRNPQYNLFNYVLWGLKKNATDPRDKIYAFLGLVPNESMQIPVQVDYSLDAVRVFTNMTMRYLLTFPDIGILGCCRGVKPCGPSWVLNSEYDESVDPLPENTLSWYDTFKAGGDAIAGQRVFSEDDELLGLQGHELDSIADVSPEPTPHPVKREGNTTMMRLWFEWTEKSNFFRLYLHGRQACKLDDGKLYEHTNQPIREAFCHTILVSYQGWGGTSGLDPSALRKLFEDFDSLVVKAIRFANTPGSLKFFLNYAQTFYGMSIDTDGHYLFDSFYTMTETTRKRRFIVTEKGYIGLAPWKTQVGDKVVLLQGHKTPVVARPVDGRWKLLGDCYIHGVMEGEAFDQEKCELIWFE